MKKIKIIFATVLSLICFSFLFVLAGCNSGKISDIDYKCEGSYGIYSVRGTFKHSVTHGYSDVKNITFTLCVYENNELIAKERITTNDYIYGSGYSFSKNLGDSVNNPDDVTISIKNVVVEDGETKLHKYTPYAIGFGVTAGVLLAGAVVIFVLDKKGILKKHK